MKRIFVKAAVKTFTVFLAVAMLVTGVGMASDALAAPPTPQWLPGQPLLAGQQIIAMWMPVPGAVKYVLYLNGKQIAESAANQYIGVAPLDAGEHRYTVAALDASGAASAPSAPGIIRITKISPPEEITIRADEKSRDVFIRWGGVAGGSIYNIYKAESPDGPFKLLASQTDLAYKDSGLEYEKTYYYAISAKDVTSKESDRSKPVEVLIKQPAVSDEAKLDYLNLDFKAVKTKQIGADIEFIDLIYGVTNTKFVQRLSDGMVYYNDGQGNVHVLDGDTMKPVETLNPAKPEVVGGTAVKIPSSLGFKYGSLALSPDGGLLYLPVREYVIAYDRAKMSPVWAGKVRFPTEEEDPQVFSVVTGSMRRGTISLDAVGVLPDGTVIASAGSTSMLFWLDGENGELLGWSFGYLGKEDSDGNRERIIPNIVTEVIPLPDGTMLLGEPLGKKILHVQPDVMETEFEVIKVIGKKVEGFLGGFLGITGVDTVKGENWIIVADPAFGTIQIFDVETSSYLMSIGDETGKMDPSSFGRALQNWSLPVYPILQGFPGPG
jgi:hypothetical protein